ncbi:MAG: hypothetical protein Q8N99_01310 [Nanoarchaeota archaeon]|nr:hypothetical protein [Nanoarchaeota archaeon]
MDDRELFELRKEHHKVFARPGDLITFLEGLMPERFELPLVVGYPRYDPKTEWRIVHLNPREVSDELTVRNYFEGLRKVNEALTTGHLLESEPSDPIFKALLVYEGIEAPDKNHQDELILGIQVGVGHPLETAGGYRLSRSFSLDLFNKGSTYYAKTEIHRPKLDEIIEPYMGPK